MRIREATPEDAARIGELTVAAYRTLPQPLSRPYEQMLADGVSRFAATTTVLVAEDEAGEVVGSVTLVLHEDPYWFEHEYGIDGDCGFRMLAVDPTRRGEQIGSRLMHECIRRAREAGRSRMVITTMPWMTQAHRMYERVGFRRRPDLDLHFPSGQGWAYVLDLERSTKVC
jgi:predicted N-acetyltransferase YhbS